MSFSDVFVVLFVLIWGAAGIPWFFRKSTAFSRREIRFLQGLYTFHLVIALVYCYYIRANGGDANSYWFNSQRFSVEVSWGSYYRTGTNFILFITYPLVKYLHISFYTGGLLFATVGFQGFLYLHCIIRKFIKKPVRVYGLAIYPYVLFLPNLHFWSSSIGKDSLILYAILLFFYCLFHLRKKWFWGLFALVLAYHIRPHIALFMMVASFIAILIDGKLKLSLKLGLGLLMLIGGILMFNMVVSFMKIDDVNTETLSQYSTDKAANLNKGSGSAVAISSYPFPLKVFTFLYRPLFFDINNALAVISSFENSILLLLSLYLLTQKPIDAFRRSPMPIKAIFIFFVITSSAFALTLSNLGIILRLKNPVIFCLLIFIFWCFAYKQHLKKINRI